MYGLVKTEVELAAVHRSLVNMLRLTSASVVTSIVRQPPDTERKPKFIVLYII